VTARTREKSMGMEEFFTQRRNARDEEKEGKDFKHE
jgi:hypothetical protein